jgi:hypothetical protein
MKWANGDFITLTDPDLILLVRAGGVPETVEFRAHDEGYVTSTHVLEDDVLADISGQLDRMVGKGELTRAAADAYLRVNLGDEY